jgi:DHA2 family multidrug resistance protein
VVACGLCIIAFGLIQLSHFDLQADMRAVILAWIVSRSGTAFLFVPINVMAFYFVPPDKVNSATGLINLARNLGGSMGISLVATMLDRRAQFHQASLAGDLNGGNGRYLAAIGHLTHRMIARGEDAAHAAHMAHGFVYQQLLRQSMMYSFVDTFWFMAMICLAVVPLLFLMKKAKPGGRRAPVH